MPQVSVIIPAYNRADMIGDAIQSVLDQTYADWELIVVDDGSEDNTADVIAGYDDPRISYIYQDNRKLPGARNTGIRAASGPYVAFLDSDDLFLPHKLEWQVAALDAQPELGLIAGGHVEVDKQLHILREVQPWHGQPTLELTDWLVGCPFCPSSPLIRREWLFKANLFDEAMQRIEDWDLWLRMSRIGCKMAWLHKPVCYYRFHGGNMVRDVHLMKAGMVRMLDKFYAQSDLPVAALALRDLAYAHVYLSASARAYAAGAIEEGKASLKLATRLNPALLEGDPPQLLDSLAAFALIPLVEDAATFMEMLVHNLPEGLGIPRWSARKARGLLYAITAFDCRQRREYWHVVKGGLSALVLDPSWLRNRGLISIVGHSLARSITSTIFSIAKGANIDENTGYC
jgi:glycosyltransferase involved in cell wall biosynthesis